MKRYITAVMTFFFLVVSSLVFITPPNASASKDLEPQLLKKGAGKSAAQRALMRSNMLENVDKDINHELLQQDLQRITKELIGPESFGTETQETLTFESGGSWFQGWYTRIVDHDNQLSLAVVGASQYLPEESSKLNSELPGYIGVIINFIDKNNEEMTVVYDAFPEQTVFWSNREMVLDDPSSTEWESFYWRGKGKNGLIAVITNESIKVSIPGYIKVSATIGERNPYNSLITWLGPEGLVEFLPFIPLHWFVYSLGSNSQYSFTLLDLENQEVSGTGFAHQETNWGSVFPPAWIWTEGINENNTRQFALSGGVLDLGDTTMTQWLVAYHSPYLKWQFRPTLPDTEYETEIDGCSGYFSITATDSLRKLVITAQAPTDSFIDVSVPTEDGFLPEGQESFSTQVKVQGYIKFPFFGYIRVDQYIFEGAALEFGADYACK